ncbi:MAG: PAS domain S-box protein [Deltaproteobacteria bacterium]|nr:PAS domain S-box protein [Deltaproteobacteria bacterium]
MQPIDQHDRQAFLEGLFHVSGDAFIVTDKIGFILMANKAALEMFGYAEEELLGEHFGVLSSKGMLAYPELPPMIEKLFKDGFVENYESIYKKKDGTTVCVETNVGLLYDDQGEIRGAASSMRDITRRKHDEFLLNLLHKKEQELEVSNKQLEDINTALQALLQKRDEDKKNIKEAIAANLNRLVMPYLEKMKQTCKGCDQKAYVEILETHVLDIVSPFIRNLAKNDYKLSPREVAAADLVKSGMTTKEIARHMNVSVRTVEVYRRNIRKKLSLQNKKANLQNYLSSKG